MAQSFQLEGCSDRLEICSFAAGRVWQSTRLQFVDFIFTLELRGVRVRRSSGWVHFQITLSWGTACVYA